MRRTARVNNALHGRKKAVTVAGAAAALLGAGTAGAAALVTSAPAAAAHTPHVVHAASAKASSRARAGAVRQAPKTGSTAPARQAAAPATAKAPAQPKTASHPGATAAVNTHTWAYAQEAAARATGSSEPKAANQLTPAGTAGAQAYMQLSSAQLDNAKTIVHQALAKKMGVRSAVIAVATSMQESMLSNINYGDRDSLGLFQQRPSCGWGSAQQILDPKFAADAFLGALKQHQESDPTWVRQPLWANAQAVQASGFPFAYAKWEAQAAHLVKQIVTQQA